MFPIIFHLPSVGARSARRFARPVGPQSTPNRVDVACLRGRESCQGHEASYQGARGQERRFGDRVNRGALVCVALLVAGAAGAGRGGQRRR